MDFSFNIETVLGCDSNGILVLNSSHRKFMKINYYYYVQMVINAIGSLSSVQRHFKSPITNADLFFAKENDTIIIKAQGNKVCGFIRVGYRDIYINTLNDVLEKVNLLCVFDFYVHFSCQRCGYGKELFDKVLQIYKTDPGLMAYDKPSKAMNFFLYKHYSLNNPIVQNNHMCIYYQLLLKLINESYNSDYSNNGNNFNNNYSNQSLDYVTKRRPLPPIQTNNNIYSYRYQQRTPMNYYQKSDQYENNNNMVKVGNFIMKNYNNNNQDYQRFRKNQDALKISKSSDYIQERNNYHKPQYLMTDQNDYRSRCFSPYEANVLNSIQSDNSKKFYNYYLMNDNYYNDYHPIRNGRYNNKYNIEDENSYYQ